MAAEKCGVCPFEAMDLLWFHQIVTSTKSPSKNISLISVRVSNQQTSSEVASSEVENKKQESEETTTTTKSHSSSTTTRTSMRKSRSSVDLELQEVKGFMDLGFVFKKHNLSSHVISLIPGLQRIKSQDDQDFDEEREGKVMMVPESWLVNLPNSPLILRLRISRVCNDSDTVKKHLKDWARTVATTVHQES